MYILLVVIHLFLMLILSIYILMFALYFSSVRKFCQVILYNYFPQKNYVKSNLCERHNLKSQAKNN